MSIFHNSSLIGASGNQGGYRIERSLRFNSPTDSAYLSRTFASAGNRKTWTWSGWVKRGTLGGNQKLFGGPISQDYTLVWFLGDNLSIENFNGGSITTSAVFRDTSSWYHIVAVVNTTNATPNDRMIIYVNGVRQTAGSYSAPTQNADLFLNQATEHRIARFGFSSFNNWFNGYLAEVHFIDGQALTPSSFAETNTTTGQWIPKRYSGTYGTNGFRLDFSDNSGTTSTTLGKDTSGNNNNWTPFNLSVTAGAGNDSLVDTPTSYGSDTGAGGEVRGNYATLNPPATNGGTLSNGNLEYIGPGSWKASPSTILLPSTGKWYAEATLKAAPATNTFGGMYAAFGVIAPSAVSGWNYNSGTSFFVTDTGLYANYSTGAGGTVGTFTSGTVIGLAFNRDTNQITMYQDGVSKATVTLGISSGADLLFFNGSYDGSFGQMVLNFGQRPFAYTAPSGFKAVCDTNLPAPVVAKPNTSMDVLTYTGNGVSGRNITGLSFNPDLVWIKNRSATNWNNVVDSVRGASIDLYTNATNAEVLNDTTGTVSAFNSDGFTVTTGSANIADVNGNSSSYVAWCWDAGSSTVSNTQGTITSSVRANTSAGFSIVTYTGTGTANSTFGHGLGVAPALIITKNRGSANDWYVYHSSLGVSSYLSLNQGSASGTLSNYWSPVNSNVFGQTYGAAGPNNGSQVAYCFAPVSGYSAFGSYAGNGSSDGPFVYTGFRPRWIMIKCSSVGGSGYDWIIHDTSRSIFNLSATQLIANSSAVENQDSGGSSTSGFGWDILSNGFKMRDASGGRNQSGQTYIYAAFAESPFSLARAR